MKRILNLVSVLILVAAIYFVVTNAANPVQITLGNTFYTIGLQTLMAVMYVAGLISGLCYLGGICFMQLDKIKSYKRQLEKTSVASDENDSRVAVLESKIEVLEKALKSALEK